MVPPPKLKGRKRALGQDAGPHERAMEAHRKRLRSQSLGAQLPLKARPDVPSINMKHRSYYEIVENEDKKKKLEVKETNDPRPPPGFEFVPMGNPDLTQACKDISREKDAMVLIVTAGTVKNALSQQIHRLGHHIRQTIVDQARKEIMDSEDESDQGSRPPPGVPEPIPESQREINEQADKALRDLFPRIPHTDRRIIIEHSFRKGLNRKGEPPVGLARDIPLYRRVQLAVLAHIRHTHTRYDQLLKETSYANARRTVEQLCLDTLVKWRGDEETGRDQLDEILREVIVISDSEDDGGDEFPETDSSGVESGDLGEAYHRPRRHLATVHSRPDERHHRTQVQSNPTQWHDGIASPPLQPTPAYAQEKRTKTERRGFKRYQNALQHVYSTRWNEAQQRVRQREDYPTTLSNHVAGPPIHTRHESKHDEYRPVHVDDDELQIIPDPRLTHPTEQPARRVPTWIYDTHRSTPAGTPSDNSPYVDPRHRDHPQRFVQSHEAHDHLASSIESMPPVAERRNPSLGPVFVRALSQRPEGPHQDAQGVSSIRLAPYTHDTRNSLNRTAGDQGHVHSAECMRDADRRPQIFSEPIRGEPEIYSRPVHYEQQSLAYSDAPHLRNRSLQLINEESTQQYTQAPSHTQEIQYPAAPVYQTYDGGAVENSYRVEHAALAEPVDWTRTPVTVNPVERQTLDYRGHPPAERKEPRIELVPEPSYQHVDAEKNRGPDPAYHHPPTPAPYQRLERLPPSPAHRVEYAEPYSRQSPSMNTLHTLPAYSHQDHAHPVAHPQQSQHQHQHQHQHQQPYQQSHQQQAYRHPPPQQESVPLFVRRVERYGPQPQSHHSGPEQPSRQYDDLVMRDADASPRHAADPWRQPPRAEDGVYILPEDERVDGYSPYPGPNRAHPPPQEISYRRDYPEQQQNNGVHRYY